MMQVMDTITNNVVCLVKKQIRAERLGLLPQLLRLPPRTLRKQRQQLQVGWRSDFQVSDFAIFVYLLNTLILLNISLTVIQAFVKPVGEDELSETGSATGSNSDQTGSNEANHSEGTVVASAVEVSNTSASPELEFQDAVEHSEPATKVTEEPTAEPAITRPSTNVKRKSKTKKHEVAPPEAPKEEFDSSI